MAQEHGYCGCGHYANLTDGLCLRCHDDMSRMEDEGAPPPSLDDLDDEWAAERWQDDVLEQQELEDFAQDNDYYYDDWDGNGYADDSFPYYDEY